MQFIWLPNIHKTDRVRRTLLEDKVNELAESIEKVGLLHPPVFRKEDDKFVLVAGETRVEAMTRLHNQEREFTYASLPVPRNHIPITLLSELAPDEALEAELEENLRRTDIDWKDKVAATAKLFELRQSQDPTYGRTKLVEEVSIRNATDLDRRLIVSQHLSDPDVARAKSEVEAFAVVSRKQEAHFAGMLAKRMPNATERMRLIEGDTRTEIDFFDSETFDVIIADPPYGQDADKIDAEGVHFRHAYVDDWKNALDLYGVLACGGFRVAKEQAHLYAFCNIRRFIELEEVFTLAGWWVWRRPLLWYKGQGHNPLFEYGPHYHYEAILYAIKGDRPLALTGRGDVLSHPLERNREWPAQKPTELYVDLLERSLLKGVGNVLDPFCGSGTIFDAARRLDLRATGIELDPNAIAIAKRRMNNA